LGHRELYPLPLEGTCARSWLCHESAGGAQDGGVTTMRESSGEGILLAGGAAAILLQVADPAVARGVAGYSTFAERPLDRLHGTLTYLYVIVYGTPEEASATALGVPRSAWPANRAAFAEYWSTYPLEVGDDARAIARDLLHPARPSWLRLVMPTVRVVTAGLLPPELRAAYGLDYDAARFDRLVRRTRAIYPRLPRWLRTWPARHYLRRFRGR
jgi:uncharacterized protein (DUF2236 family)